jgi:hypothetical protein
MASLYSPVWYISHTGIWSISAVLTVTSFQYMQLGYGAWVHKCCPKFTTFQSTDDIALADILDYFKVAASKALSKTPILI